GSGGFRSPPIPPPGTFQPCQRISGGIRLPRLPPAGLRGGPPERVRHALRDAAGRPQPAPAHPAGNPQKRARYFDRRSHEYFFDRHRPPFEAYGGQAESAAPPSRTTSSCPSWSSTRSSGEVIDAYKKDEGYISETVVLPEHPFKRAVWMLFEYPETSAPAFLIAIVSVVFTSILSIILFCAETLHEFKRNALRAVRPAELLRPVLRGRVGLHGLVHHRAGGPLPRLPVQEGVHEGHQECGGPCRPLCRTMFTSPNVLVHDELRGAPVERLAGLPASCPASSGCSSSPSTLGRPAGAGAHLPGQHRRFSDSSWWSALIVCILLFSSTIYYVESEVRGSQIESIPDAFWWAVITMCHRGLRRQGAEGPAGPRSSAPCAPWRAC
uniref:Neur_chan_memb domain-containing protein n=1 Tax=Macrostomum lignano TaxID=282301 RepID=A0A1I8F999_9PLAT